MNCSENVIQLNLFIFYTIQSDTICGGIYMQINSLPAGGAVVVVESEVSPVTLYTKQRSSHKRCFIRHYMQDEMKMTSNIFWKPQIQYLRKLEYYLRPIQRKDF